MKLLFSQMKVTFSQIKLVFSQKKAGFSQIKCNNSQIRLTDRLKWGLKLSKLGAMGVSIRGFSHSISEFD
jgi:hypothetical protein